MRIAVSVLAILFGLLHLIAAVAQLKSKDPAARGSASLMICGGAALICSAIAHLVYDGAGSQVTVLSAGVCGFLPICFAAYLNGRRSGNVHVSHHLIRGGIAILLVSGLFLW